MTRRLELEPATEVSTDLDSLVFWPTVAAQGVRARTRLASIDLLRGLVIVLIALAWACLLAALYPACRRFAELKRRRSDG